MNGTAEPPDDEPTSATKEVDWDTSRAYAGPNPFVGPRPIGQGEPFHGRDKDLQSLFDVLQARRIVVLHGPAGAGKTSLVQGGLVPRLKDAQFDVWRPIRVGLDVQGMDGVPEGTNRYVLSAMVSLEAEIPESHRRSPAELAALELHEYLQTRPRRKGRAGRSVALLFDDFEEILSLDANDEEAKQEFFAALGRALEDEGYWALLVIREDDLGALVRFRRTIPAELSTTVRLDLPSLAEAEAAITKLASTAGRFFPAAPALIARLSTQRTERPDGTSVEGSGQRVDLRLLQTVCQQLWDSIPSEELSIEEEHLEPVLRDHVVTPSPDDAELAPEAEPAAPEPSGAVDEPLARQPERPRRLEAMLGVVAVALAVLAALGWWERGQAVQRAEQERQRAEQAARRAEQALRAAQERCDRCSEPSAQP